MKRLADFKKILIILGVLALVIIALHYLMYQDLKSKNENISRLQYDLSTKSIKQDYLISTGKNLKNLEAELDQAQTAIVGREEDINFIEKIESVARANGLNIEIESLVLTNQELPSPDLATLNVKAKTKGSWSGTYLFLAELESMPLKLSIERVSLVRGGADSGSVGVVWDGSIELVVLKYK